MRLRPVIQDVSGSWEEFYNHEISKAPSRGLSYRKECKKSHGMNRSCWTKQRLTSTTWINRIGSQLWYAAVAYNLQSRRRIWRISQSQKRTLAIAITWHVDTVDTAYHSMTLQKSALNRFDFLNFLLLTSNSMLHKDAVERKKEGWGRRPGAKQTSPLEPHVDVMSTVDGVHATDWNPRCICFEAASQSSERPQFGRLSFSCTILYCNFKG